MKNAPDFRALVHSPSDLSAEHLAWAESIQTGQGIRWGIPAIDRVVIPMQPGNLTCLIARPGSGKTSLMAYLARHEAAVITARGATDEAVVYVTWEQSAEELEAFFQTDGTYSISDIAWGRVDLEIMRQRAVKRAKLPIWVIGHGIGRADRRLPRMTPEAVLHAVETMHEDYGVKPSLLLFDYMQIIPVGRADDRVKQVTEVPILIKELNLRIGAPAVVGVQASREVDTRTIKIPELADAQWACLAGDGVVLNAATGLMHTIAELYQTGLWQSLQCHTLDEKTARLRHARIAGMKQNPPEQIYRVDCGGDGCLRVNARHKFYTPDGWKETQNLRQRDWVALARHLHTDMESDISCDRAYILGLLLGDGTVTRAVTFTNSESELLTSFSEAVEREWGGQYAVSIRKQTYWNTYDATIRRADGAVFPGGNGALLWLKEIGVFGMTAESKNVPNLRLGNAQVASLVAGLFATDGSVTFRNNRVQVTFSGCSRQLVISTRLLLLRLGIHSTIYRQERRGRRMPMWHLRISGIDLPLFCNLVRIPGRKGRLLSDFFSAHPNMNGRSMGDLMPPKFNLLAIEALKKVHLRTKYNNVKGRAVTRGRLLKVALETGDKDLERIAEADLRWARIKGIVPDGIEPTYDLCVPQFDNLVVSGFVVHNSSIEQTADKVFGLWRPAVTEEDDTRIELSRQQYPVNDQLFVLRLLKQRGDRARFTWVLHFHPAYLQLAELEIEHAAEWERDK